MYICKFLLDNTLVLGLIRSCKEVLISDLKKNGFLCSYRITVGNKTCVFEKERDPTVLCSPSAGKLLQYIVEDGEHVMAGCPYAEIEVI